MKKIYNEKELEEFVEQFGYFVDDRVNIVYDKIRHSKEYKEKHEIYSKLYDKLIEKYSLKEIEEFAESCMDLYNLENLYIYAQGILDGIFFKDNFNNDKSN